MVLDKDYNLVRTVETGQTPYGISYNHAGDRIFVATNKDKMLQVFDAKTYEKSKIFPLVTVAGISLSRQMTNKSC